MRYTLIAAALIGAVVAMPAAPASYGSEAPAAYNEPEQIYGTQVSNQQTTTAAALPSSTCTDEAENIVPYTQLSQMAESSAPSYGGASSAVVSSVASSVASDVATKSGVPAMQTSASMASPSSPAAGTPMGYASKSVEQPMDVSSSTGSSPDTPAVPTSPAEDVASSTEVSPQAPSSYAASSAVPVAPESTSPVESSPEMPAAGYGSTIVPGSAPTAAPYPVGGEASPVAPQGTGMATGTVGVAKPTGTGSVSGTQEFEGAASSVTAAGLFVSFGAVIALFM